MAVEGGRSDRVVVLPVVCLAVRREGALTGLYPCWNAGRHDAVEDGLVALEAGESVENFRTSGLVRSVWFTIAFV